MTNEGDGAGHASRLAAIHDQYAAKIALLSAEREAGALTFAQASEQAQMATAAYDRDRALAELQADTGWKTWVGVGGLLYAQHPRSTPVKTVRAVHVTELRAAVEKQMASQDGA